MAENINITLQKLANNSAKAIQDSVNKANKQGLEFNAKEAEKARKFNAQEAATARAWQEKMSKSAHQMEVSDLKKAGLNPVLSANSGGAQSYTTSSASANNASGDVESGSNAYGSIFAGLMSNMAGLKQSEMSAQAQRYSADRSYHAAELSAMAQKYAADQSAAASKYVADRNYQAQMNKPQNTVTGVLDKYLGNRYGSKAISEAEAIAKKAWTIRKDNKGHTYVDIHTRDENRSLDQILNKLGYNQYYLNHCSDKQRNQLRDLAAQAFMYNNKSAMQKLAGWKKQ